MKHFAVSDKALYFAVNTNIDYARKDIQAQSLRENTPMEEESKTVRSYEIDFLLSRKDKICPVEVKSSGYNSHKSLDKFQHKFSARILDRYLLYTKDVRKDKDIFCLPVYMTELL